MIRFLPSLLAVVLVSSSSAFALELSAKGAAAFPTNNYDFVSSPAFLLGGQVTFGMTELFQWGATYENTFLSYKNDGGNDSLKFYGGVVRVGTMTGLFGDAQAGVAKRGDLDASFGWGIGAGYRIPFTPFIDISPRFGYRALPDSGIERSMIDFGLLFTLKI
jgi:hypothetical protein